MEEERIKCFVEGGDAIVGGGWERRGIVSSEGRCSFALFFFKAEAGFTALGRVGKLARLMSGLQNSYGSSCPYDVRPSSRLT